MTQFSLQAIDTIVVLTESPLTQRDHDRFGVPNFLAAGLRVEVWDISPMVRHNVASPVDVLPARRLTSFTEFRLALADLPVGRVCLISFLSYDTRTWRFFRSIARARIPYVITYSNFISIPQKLRLSLWRRIGNLRLEQIFSQLLSHIPRRLLGITHPSIIMVAGGNEALLRINSTYKATTIIPCHAYDYDTYLSYQKKPPITSGSTAVFLDEYLPFHPDYERFGVIPYASPQDYFPALNHFFEVLEKCMGLQVVIAAHPRARYENHFEWFPHRAIVKGRTAELVRDAQLVLLHASTAVNFAVLFEKPMFFLTSDTLNRSPWRSYIHSLAAEFGQTPINVDSPALEVSLLQGTDVKSPLYANYINRYLKVKGTADKPCWQFLIDYLKNGGTPSREPGAFDA